MTAHSLPALGPNRKLKVPTTAERTLPNGLTVIVVRRPVVPLVEVRLRIPFARAHLSRGAMLSQTLFSGTSELTGVDIAAELQTVGGALSAGLDPDRLLISGNALTSGLDRLLDILAGVLADAAYPSSEVATERERLVDNIQVALSQPAHLARVALLRRVYGKHPYAVQTPEPEAVRKVRPAHLRALHTERMHPAGATLVLVGDVQPARALDAAERALGGWNAGGNPTKKHLEVLARFFDVSPAYFFDDHWSRQPAAIPAPPLGRPAEPAAAEPPAAEPPAAEPPAAEPPAADSPRPDLSASGSAQPPPGSPVTVSATPPDIQGESVGNPGARRPAEFEAGGVAALLPGLSPHSLHAVANLINRLRELEGLPTGAPGPATHAVE